MCSANIRELSPLYKWPKRASIFPSEVADPLKRVLHLEREELPAEGKGRNASVPVKVHFGFIVPSQGTGCGVSCRVRGLMRRGRFQPAGEAGV